MGEPGKADPKAPGDEDKDAKAAKLRERVRERLKARQAAAAAVPDAAGAPSSKRDREVFPDRRGGGGREASQDRRRRGSLRPRSRRAGRGRLRGPGD